MSQKITPRQHEIQLGDNEFIVTKTDEVGKITYANPVFIALSGYSEFELLGSQHNIVRHPDMPRSVFNLLWTTIKSGDEFHGYVKNLSKDGSFYWVFATVTPSFSTDTGNIIGFYSVRRKPDRKKLAVIQDLYREMLMAEKSEGRRDAIAAGNDVLNTVLKKADKTYYEFILTL